MMLAATTIARTAGITAIDRQRSQPHRHRMHRFAQVRVAASVSQPLSSGATCYAGPRGGTYTITASGRKNYGGCSPSGHGFGGA